MRIPRSVSLVIVSALLLLPAAVRAQGNGAIAGVVRDTSGAVIPGVTVEASSPALIEKVRVVVSDDQGLYRIVDLRPGLYTVTFTLPGFTTLRREGVELAAAFTATVNAELTVGALEETLTVSGAAPLVDTQNVNQQQTLARTTLDALPSTMRLAAYATLLPGAVSGSQDVGGVMGERGAAFAIHGGRSADINTVQDGINLTAMNSTTFSWNPHTSQEIVLQTGGISAESETAGVLVNIIPKDGGNVFSGSLATAYSNPDLQSSNLTEALQARGLTSTPSVRTNYDVGGSVGGPLRQDKLWFFTAHRKWVASRYVPGNFSNRLQNSPVGDDPIWRVLFYEPDPDRPAFTNDFYRDHSLRLTWQASAKDKFGVSYSIQDDCNCPLDDLAAGGNLPAPEATGHHYYQPNWLFSASWSRPTTNRLLIEAGVGATRAAINSKRPPGVGEFDIAITELSTNTRYGSRAGTGIGPTSQYGTSLNQFNVGQRFSVSYITGTHALKTGINLRVSRRGHKNHQGFNQTAGARAYAFRNRVPVSVTLFALPGGLTDHTLSTGIYAQDQWTIRRVTLNLGLRYDGFSAGADAQSLPAGPFVPARELPAVSDSPAWTNINPRIGAAYDLFGTGRTAVKGFVGRYSSGTSGNGNAALNNPMNNQATSATRTWNDVNGNYVPDCVLGPGLPDANGECGPLSDRTFGQVRTAGSTTYADDVLGGFNSSQPYNWQASLALQHEVRPGLGVNIAYFRTWYGNFNLTENQALTPADYDAYCITAPTDARLPGGGGNQICGLYDIRPTRFGQVSNLIAKSRDYGTRTEVFDGIDVTLNARFAGRGVLSGGLSTGRTVTDTCALNDQPNVITADIAGFATLPRTSEYCRLSQPWSAGTQLKFLVVYPLPWGLQTSATYQNLPGIPVTASYVATNAQVRASLGRDLGACRGAATCNATTTVALIPPNTLFEDRLQQVDLRFTRRFDVGRARLNANFDLYNAFNNGSVLASVTAYGPRYLDAVNVLAGRLFKFGFQVDF